jgi:hypothetical protein
LSPTFAGRRGLRLAQVYSRAPNPSIVAGPLCAPRGEHNKPQGFGHRYDLLAGLNDGHAGPMTVADCKHFILTRYFVRFDPNAPIAVKPGWFEERLRLFETYCLPSMVAQTDQDFIWLLYFDPATPARHVEQIRSLIAPHPHFRIKFNERFTPETVRKDVIEEAGSGAGWLLTTRFDNDDGLRRDFIARLHAGVRPGTREFLNVPAGLIDYRGRLLLYRDGSNAFISLFEPAQDAVTVLCAQHQELRKFGSIRQIDPFPAFVQVVHGGNLSNKPRGPRVHKALALAGFEAIPALYAGPLEESDGWIMAENLTAAVLWRIRDDVIRIAKAVRRAFRGR